MEGLLRLYYFPEHLNTLYGYNNICRSLNEILHFRPPQNLSLKVLRCLSPYFSVGCDLLMPTDRNVEISVCSDPIFQPNSQSFNGSLLDSSKSRIPFNRNSRAHLFYGSISENSKTDLVYSFLLSPNTLFTATGAVSFNRVSRGPSPVFAGAQLVLMNKWNNVNSYLSYSTRQQTLGASVMTTVKYAKGLSVGGELYFSALDLTGTTSLGLKYIYNGAGAGLSERHQDCFIFIMNPIFGQIMSAFTCVPVPGLFSCLRYDFNVHSYNADLSLGFEYTPEKDVGKSSAGSSHFSKVRLRLGREIALSLVYHPIKLLSMELGLLLNPFCSSSNRLGIEIQLH